MLCSAMLGLGPTGAHSATALLCPLLRVDRFNRGHVPEAAGCGKDKGLASSCSCLFWSLSPKQHFCILAVDIGSSLCFFLHIPWNQPHCVPTDLSATHAEHPYSEVSVPVPRDLFCEPLGCDTLTCTLVQSSNIYSYSLC